MLKTVFRESKPNRVKRSSIHFLSVFCDWFIHGSFLFSPRSSPWKQNTFYSAISMHHFIKPQQRKHIHVPFYSVLLKFEPKKQHQPQNLQELQNPIRPFSQSPSCLSISHCPFWRYPLRFSPTSCLFASLTLGFTCEIYGLKRKGNIVSKCPQIIVERCVPKF